MSVSAEDFLAQSVRLLDGDSEIDFRSAISRAYYCNYHTALDAARRLGLPIATSRDCGLHEQLIQSYEAQGKRLKIIARQLRDKKRARAVADYQLDELVPKEEAQLYLKESKTLTAELSRLGQPVQSTGD